MRVIPGLVLAALCSSCCSTRTEVPVLHIQGEITHPLFAWYQIQSHGAWVKEGAMITFYDSGGVQSIQNVVGNELNGPAWEYLPDGKPVSIGHYTHGKPTGVWRIWAPNGTFHDKDLDK